MRSKPGLAITMGDAAGIGPEVTLKALTEPEISENAECVLVGSFAIWQRCAAVVGFPRELVPVTPAHPFLNVADKLGVITCSDLTEAYFKIGVPNWATGQAAARAIETATHLALTKKVDAVVTAPIQKEALNAAGFYFAGHTEMLQKLAGAESVVMLMYSSKLITALLSTHLALTQTMTQITAERILHVIRLTIDFLACLGRTQPRIAVAGLNPHSGEGGLFGQEEIKIIAPAVKKAQKLGLPVWGPFPPDTIFYQASRGQYDVVIAMFHDQGMIPFKLLAFDEGVNVTLGLPFWRTSPDHGTALDLAGKHQASHQSMRQAILLAAKLAGASHSAESN
ncbi:4-hydroxythreonine-4-phosphate dehydrogenase PdxA [candidate division KSB1 bacterium]|nr:4-hydroxythreonine-4-phosphate dehydrogenase PdxA [candidate division KSB1 bacterium]